jgi:hypothetical protein
LEKAFAWVAVNGSGDLPILIPSLKPPQINPVPIPSAEKKVSVGSMFGGYPRTCKVSAERIFKLVLSILTLKVIHPIFYWSVVGHQTNSDLARITPSLSPNVLGPISVMLCDSAHVLYNSHPLRSMAINQPDEIV